MRPWLLALLFIVTARWPARRRLATATIGLFIAIAGEAAWIGLLGGDAAEGWRGLLAAIGLIVAFEGVCAFAGWVAVGRRWLTLAIVAALLLSPGVIPFFEKLSLVPPVIEAERDRRPPLMLLSGVPLAWDEAGVAASLGGGGDARVALDLLNRGFLVRPITDADLGALGGKDLLMVAQPRIDAAGLVAIDAWVRRGGRALILSDPDLRWPSRLPAGDPRRPPGPEPLSPLLAHWNLSLAPDPDAGAAPRLFRRDGVLYRVRPGAPGRWRGQGASCRLSATGLIADCAIGRGRAVLVADVDLLLDDLWVGVGSHGTDRYGRTADNGRLLIAILDELAGIDASETADSAPWIAPATPAGLAALLLLLPGAMAILVAGIAWRYRRLDTIEPENPTNLSTGPG